ncbi:L-threonylcarbamoyladenylate synthase [Tardisphaera miroshnichenkoae]
MIYRSNDAWEDDVRQALREGKLVVYPTDTVYGMGGDATLHQAVQAMNRVKGEREMKPYPVLTYSKEKAFEAGVFNDNAIKIAERYWPGAVTIVVPRRDERLSGATFGSLTVGLRVPADPIARKVAELSPSGFIIGTSANRSGAPPPSSVEEVDASVIREAAVVINGGRRSILPSTVISIGDGSLHILREGAVKAEEIKRLLGLE